MAEFTGRRVVVMGGSRGIGRSTALEFARQGAAVAICARTEAALLATKAEIAALGVPCYAAQADLADAEAIARFVPEAAAALGGINVLVNNASGFGRGDDEASWAASVSVDLMAIIRATSAALPLLEHASDGCVVNVSSISAMRATKRNQSYGAIKAAVIHYTASQARMLAARGLRVNGVAPGSIEFPGGKNRQNKNNNDNNNNNNANDNNSQINPQQSAFEFFLQAVNGEINEEDETESMM